MPNQAKRYTKILGAGSLLALAVIALWVYLRPSFGPGTHLAPPPPARGQASPARPTASLSSVFLPLHIPIAALRERLEREVPLTFHGEERDPVRDAAVADDALAWNARRGPIQVVAAQADRLVLKADVIGEARIRGVVRPASGTLGKLLGAMAGSIAEVPFSARADALATLTVTIRPRLMADWRVQPNATAKLDVQRAEVPVAGITRVDVRPLVKKALDRKLREQLDLLEQRVAHDDRLQRMATQAWTQMHRVEQLSKDPVTWLVVRPVRIAATPVEIGKQAIRLGLEVQAETQLVVAANAPVQSVRPMPALTVAASKPGRLRLQAMGIASWDRLNAALAERLEGRRLQGSDGTEVQVRSAELSPWGDGILLSLDIDAEHGRWYQASGRLYLTARPRLDVQAQQLYLDDLDFALETRDALATLAHWLLEPSIVEALRQSASIDLSPYVERARGAASAALHQFVAQAPDGLQLSADLREMRVVGVTVAAENLQIAVDATADLAATVTQLNF